jgi:hypothetical protein
MGKILRADPSLKILHSGLHFGGGNEASEGKLLLTHSARKGQRKQSRVAKGGGGMGWDAKINFLRVFF